MMPVCLAAPPSPVWRELCRSCCRWHPRGFEMPPWREGASRGVAVAGAASDAGGYSERTVGIAQGGAETVEEEVAGIWDSNAESVRSSRPKKGCGMERDMAEEGWRRWSSSDFREWDWDDVYEDNDSEENSNWWGQLFSTDAHSRADDDGDGDEDDDGEEDEFSLFDFDIKGALSILSWMFPVSIILLPWLLGNPMLVMMAFILPVARKAMGILFPDIWSFLLKGLNLIFWSNRKSSNNSVFGRRKDYPSFMQLDDAEIHSWKEYGQAPSRFSTASRSNVLQRNRLADVRGMASAKNDRRREILSTGRWAELEEGMHNTGKLTRARKKAGLNSRSKRKETPLFLRLLIALFPFLRSWGGFL